MHIRKIKAAFGSVSASLFFTQTGVAVTALIVNILSARALGPEARGELAFFMQIAYVANALSVLGRHRAYLKIDSSSEMSLATTHKDIRHLSWVPLTLALLTGVTVVAVVARVLDIGAVAILLASVGMFTLIYSGIQQKTLRAAAIVAGNAKPYFFSTMSGQILLLAGAVFLTSSGIATVSVWLVLYGASVMLPYLVTGPFVTRHSSAKRSSASRLTSVKRLGYKLMPMTVAEVVGARIDRFLIPALANFSQLGVYTVVVTMTELIAWPIKNYTDSRVPQWSRAIANARFDLAREVLLVSTAITGLGLIVGFTLRGLLIPLFGEEYAEGLQMIWPLVLAAALHGASHFGANLNLAAGHTAIVNAVPISSMTISALAYLVLIPKLGAVGAAWGLVIGYATSIFIALIGITKIAKLTRGTTT